MTYKIKKTIPYLFYTFFSLLLFSGVYSKPLSEKEFKKIEITGAVTHSKSFLITSLKLDSLKRNQKHFKQVAEKIEKFYKNEGYTLVKATLLQETNENLIIFIDEGRLGRVVFLNLGSFNFARVKSSFKLRNNIYNEYLLHDELEQIEQKFGLVLLKEELRPTEDYSKAFFQLDAEFDIPLLGKRNLPIFDTIFFDKYGYRYNLFLKFGAKKGIQQYDGQERLGYSIKYGIKTSYSRGLIPNFNYKHFSLFGKDDYLKINASMGVQYGYYGSKIKFNEKPKQTFAQGKIRYNLSPFLKEIISPKVEMDIYNSASSRGDIGLEKFKFTKVRGKIAPGITFLEQFRMYTGLGWERIYIFDSKIDETAENPAKIKPSIDDWGFLEASVIGEIFYIPLRFILKNTGFKFEENEIKLIYSFYFGHSVFHKLMFSINKKFEYENLSSLTIMVDFIRIWNKTSFYNDIAVSNSSFKGFMGLEYHTRGIARNSNHYKFSIYKDKIYGGMFLDLVWFKGSGNDPAGHQFGFVSGVSGHIVFFDQFEFEIYFGRDYLFNTKESQNNNLMKFSKKW